MIQTMSQEMSHQRMRTRSSLASLRASGGARTVLVAMAASEDRAARIRELKDARPDLTWERIADYCGVKERSAIEWSRTGGITHENCMKLANLFDVPEEWLWSGREDIAGHVDLMSQFNPMPTRLDYIEAKLNAIMQHLGIPQPSTGTVEEHVLAVEAAEDAAETRDVIDATRRTTAIDAANADADLDAEAEPGTRGKGDASPESPQAPDEETPRTAGGGDG